MTKICVPATLVRLNRKPLFEKVSVLGQRVQVAVLKKGKT